MKRGAAFLALTLAILCLAGCAPTWPPRGWRQADYGSFSPDVTYSYDGEYRAVQTLERPEGWKVDAIRVTVYEEVSDKVVDSFLTQRAMDFWGICWEEDNYDIWIQSADVGTYCMSYEDGHWVHNDEKEMPETIKKR